MVSLRLRPSSRIVSTTSCLNSGVYRLFGTPFGIKITPLVIQYIILSNKWGAVQALMASGILDSSLKFHLQNAKNHGVTGEEMAEILTHSAFYAGWTKAWAAFRMAKEVWEETDK